MALEGRRCSGELVKDERGKIPCRKRELFTKGSAISSRVAVQESIGTWSTGTAPSRSLWGTSHDRFAGEVITSYTPGLLDTAGLKTVKWSIGHASSIQLSWKADHLHRPGTEAEEQLFQRVALFSDPQRNPSKEARKRSSSASLSATPGSTSSVSGVTNTTTNSLLSHHPSSFHQPRQSQLRSHSFMESELGSLRWLKLALLHYEQREALNCQSRSSTYNIKLEVNPTSALLR